MKKEDVAGGPRRLSPVSSPSAIHIVRARTHNLKNVSCSVPVGALTVVTGPSGSGKSSLAFDTLYAEGQRRFVESMSTYARQYLERLERPDVDLIEHILPGIAIEQRAPARSARSTVGTATEIHDVLRLLFTSVGVTVCPKDGLAVRRDTPETVLKSLLQQWGEGTRILVVAPRLVTDFEKEASEWKRLGLFRVLGAFGAVSEISSKEGTPLDGAGRVPLLVGRLVLAPDDPETLSTLSSGFDLGDGELVVHRFDDPGGSFRRFFRGLVCNGCGTRFPDPVPALFSFNSPRGACETCQGFGRIVGIDIDRVIPDPRRTLKERPIAPFNSPAYESAYDDLRKASRRLKLRWDVPWESLTQRERDAVWKKRGDWYGVEGLFEYLEKKRYKVHVRVFLSRYRGYATCPACGGTRLKPEALNVKAAGKTIAELCELTLDGLLAWLKETPWSGADRGRGGSLLEDLLTRVSTLVQIGLGYITLSRQMRTLSGGEAQRIQLGSAVGNSLTGTLYVLDEPTVGLHPCDTRRLLGVIRRLADRGNAVVAVEHDVTVMRAADHIVDLGPGAGAHGGRVVFEGTPEALKRSDTATGEALRRTICLEGNTEREELLVAEGEPRPFGASFLSKQIRSSSPFAAPAIRIVGARAHNLQNLTLSIPLGRLVGVAGVSGSGKSSLVVDVLAAGARRRMGKGLLPGADEVGQHDAIEGLENVSDVVLVDQSPLGRSSRSNPATYTKAWDEVRALLARTPAATRASLEKGAFSFNAPGGRCETCEGSGVVSIDMQFLADVTVVCEACDGRRFKPDVLNVRLRGRNVDELLKTTVDEARGLFCDVAPLVEKLAPLSDAGLGYLTLGQSTATLSGGEAQRLKVASFLRSGALSGRVLFIFDEPTTGLHPSDVDVLLRVFRRLLEAGHSIVAVEHHTGFLARADHLIELGPGGGPAGGHVLFEGPPLCLAREGTTPTAEALRREG
jgi:excinuclease ABC subunit A